MKAFVITLKNNDYSNEVADRCIRSADKFGLVVEKFYGVDKEHAEQSMKGAGLKWTWAKNNTEKDVCPVTGLHQHPYMNGNKPAAYAPKAGCAISHYMLWEKCVELDEPIVILEHDAVFINNFPHDIEFTGIIMINDPTGATPHGAQWANHMKKRGPGVFEKTWIRNEQERITIPDGLAGNSAYIIKPWAAQDVIDLAHKVGLWHNDALLCRQNFSYLEEYYPFITVVRQTQSTSSL